MIGLNKVCAVFIHIYTACYCVTDMDDNEYHILQIVQGGKVSWISRVNWQMRNFYVKHFHLVLKMTGHGPGCSLKNSCDLLSALGKFSRIMLPSQNY